MVSKAKYFLGVVGMTAVVILALGLVTRKLPDNLRGWFQL